MDKKHMGLRNRRHAYGRREKSMITRVAGDCGRNVYALGRVGYYLKL